VALTDLENSNVNSPDAGGADELIFQQVIVAGDGVYFLTPGSPGTAQFSSDGTDFIDIGLSGLSTTTLVFAAALPAPGALVAVDSTGVVWTCAPNAAPPTALSCQQLCANVPGASAVAYDATPTLWIAAAAGLYTFDSKNGTCGLVAPSPEPLKLVATVPGLGGPGAVYATGVAHSFVYR
jgi:hypothetical protein